MRKKAAAANIEAKNARLTAEKNQGAHTCQESEGAENEKEGEENKGADNEIPPSA